MRTIVHFSDMHFGKLDRQCIGPMLSAIRAIKPDLIIISGDFTQRARVGEFDDAAAFLKKLEHPYFVIPGNHDIRPLYSPIARIIDPYDRYKKHISPELQPVYVDKEIAVASVNTVRPSAIKDGRVSRKQIRALANWFKENGGKRTKIVVTHHPFDLPITIPKRKLARRADMAIEELAEAGIDLYLSGHYHQSSIAYTAERYQIESYAAIAVQAGTISTRQRKEAQSFNIIFTERTGVQIDTYLYSIKKKRFNLLSSKNFEQKNGIWKEQAL